MIDTKLVHPVTKEPMTIAVQAQQQLTAKQVAITSIEAQGEKLGGLYSPGILLLLHGDLPLEDSDIGFIERAVEETQPAAIVAAFKEAWRKADSEQKQDQS